MKEDNKISARYFLNISIFSKSWLLLLLLVTFFYGCSSNYNNSIQPSALKEHGQSEDPMPIISYQPDKKVEDSTKPSVNLYPTPVLIKAKNSQLNIRPSLINQTLALGNSHIQHWPLEVPACQPCNLEIKRVFYPDGPNTLLVLKDDTTNYQWGILQSGQKQVYLLGAKLFFDPQGMLNMAQENTSKDRVILHSGKSFNYKNCQITPLWIENKQSMSSDYSDDQAKHKIQILFECQSK